MHTKLTHADNIYCTPYDKTLKAKTLRRLRSSCVACIAGYSSRFRSRVALIISLAVRCALTKLWTPKARPIAKPTAPPIITGRFSAFKMS